VDKDIEIAEESGLACQMERGTAGRVGDSVEAGVLALDETGREFAVAERAQGHNEAGRTISGVKVAGVAEYGRLPAEIRTAKRSGVGRKARAAEQAVGDSVWEAKASGAAVAVAVVAVNMRMARR
jgi:hypothetical protein